MTKGKQIVGSVMDFLGNRQHMEHLNLKDADKYFHCKANYQASGRGPAGYRTAQALSIGKEIFDYARKGYFDWPDMKANLRGQKGRKQGLSLEKTCGLYWPKSDEKKNKRKKKK